MASADELRRVLQGDVAADGQALPVGGHVLLFRQRDLQALNAAMTRAPADAWLAETMNFDATGKSAGNVDAIDAVDAKYNKA